MPGPSGYTTAFTHPDPLDPNDAQRQRTQAKAGNYPYDQPTSYGKAMGTDSGGGAYQIDGGVHPPEGEETGADRPLSVWDRLSDISDAMDHDPDLQPVEIGMQGRNADLFGYGSHGLKGEGMDALELELDALKRDFRDSYRDTRPAVRRMGRPELLSLLVDLDPDYTAERLGPDGDDELQRIYDEWAADFGALEEDR